MKLFDYDANSIDSIYNYAKKLEGMTFQEILDEYEKDASNKHMGKYRYSKTYDSQKTVKDIKINYNNKDYGVAINTSAKGQLGNLIEKFYFGYNPNSSQSADFEKVGIELKQTPIDITKKGEYRAGERLSITNISFNYPVEDDFYKSHLWNKMKCILLIQYLRDKSIDRLEYTIKFVNLFSPPKEDLKIIIEDYKKINEKIKQGKADELSESDTLYLGACTKGATAEKSKRPQYYGEHTLARKRNYCFKNSYMTYVLQNYILKNNVPCESILKENINIKFTDYIVNLINKHIGMTDKELCLKYNRKYNNNKAQWKDLSFRMLGIKSNHAAEFEKANIVVKTIRIEKNGKNRESISFAPFKFKELVEEEWENSTIFNYFDTTQFLFVIFKNNGESYTLLGSQLWHMPYNDLNKTVCCEWNTYKNIIKNGITFKKNIKVNGKIEIKNNLPGMKDTKILHIRPHSNKSAYLLLDGFKKGNIEKDADELPNGEWMTKQSFWLKNSYILKQLIKK